MEATSSQIYNELGDGLKLFIKKNIKNEHDADDIFQDIFIKIHTKISKLRNRGKINSWVYQIARNTIIDYKRKKEFDNFEGDIPDLLQFEKESDETLAQGLSLIIDTLPEKYRSVLKLKNYSEMKNSEIAENLNISKSALKTRIYRANIEFKNRVQEFCHFEFDRYGMVIDYAPTDCFICHIKKLKKS